MISLIGNVRKDYIIPEFNIGDIILWEWVPKDHHEINICFVKRPIGNSHLQVKNLYSSGITKTREEYELYFTLINDADLNILKIFRKEENITVHDIMQKYPEIFI